MNRVRADYTPRRREHGWGKSGKLWQLWSAARLFNFTCGTFRHLRSLDVCEFSRLGIEFTAIVLRACPSKAWGIQSPFYFNGVIMRMRLLLAVFLLLFTLA